MSDEPRIVASSVSPKAAPRGPRWGARAAWGAGLAVCLAVAGWAYWGGKRIEDRVYRIGYENDPPFHFRSADGGPTGLAVEIVREGAKRRGIRLEWVHVPEGVEGALRNGHVDLWPLLTIRPERRGVFHITDPYLETENSLVVPAASQVQRLEDLAEKQLGYQGNALSKRRLEAVVPGVKLVVIEAPRKLMEAVCEGQVGGALLDTSAAIGALLDGTGCGERGLRLVQQPGMRGLLGVGTRPELGAVAEQIREGITELEGEGALASIFARYNSLASYRLETAEKLITAQRRERQLTLGFAAAVLLMMLLGWLSYRLSKERDRSREMGERFRLLFENTPAGVFQFDRSLRLTECNDHFVWLLRSKRERTLGLDLNRLRDRRVLPAIEGAAEGRPGWYEGPYFATSGDAHIEVQMRTSPLYDAAGHVTGGVGIVEDISERRHTERALRESERRFRELFESVHLLALVISAEGEITHCNEFLLQVLGYERGEVVGQNAATFLDPEHASALTDMFEEAARTGTAPAMDERPITTRDGHQRFVQWNRTLLRSEDGSFAGLASLGVDVTEHRLLQQQVLQSQKLESIGRLAGGVAHDFNNHLTIINGYSELLLATFAGPPAQRRQIEQMKQAGERAAALTAQLLAFSRKQIISPRPLDLNVEIRSTEGMLRRLAGEDVHLETSLAEGLGAVFMDPGQVHQVLMNLVANARDAMPDGGRILVETANVTLDGDYVLAHPETTPGECVLLTVTDTGHGMDEKTRLSVFEPFFTTKGVGKGTGLGLATVYGIVRQSGGWIWVYSEPELGTNFKIYLPRNQSCPLPAAGVAEVLDLPTGVETVLLVEDQQAVRDLAATVLTSAGYSVLEAADAEAALQLAEARPERIDLLLTDVVLPGRNGRQLAEQLRETRPGLKVLFVSGYTENIIVSRGVLKPGVEYLSKPFSPPELVKKVREVLDA